MPRLGIVCGLASEAAIARRGGASLVRFGGPGPEGAARAARALLADGADALLSFGLAGGLDPGARPGTVVVAGRVIGPDGTSVRCDRAWHDRVMDARPGGIETVSAPLASSERPLRTPDDKAALRAGTHAVAVDMESFWVAAAARDAGARVLAVRAVADPAWREIPESAVRALGADGRIRPLAALGALIAHPREIGGFVTVARDGRAGFAALRRVASLGPGFGLV